MEDVQEEMHAYGHRLNIELDLQSLFGLHVYSCTIGWEPATPAPHLGSYTRALLVRQDRRHLIVTLFVWGMLYFFIWLV
jgi:hypothetical protein